MTIDLPGLDFKYPHPNRVTTEPLLDKVRQFVDTQGFNRNEYALGSQITSEFGELVTHNANDFQLSYTTERGTNFDLAIFSNELNAVNYFIFRLTGEKETID